MRLLVFLHRWLGVAFCLPVAMWFATGIVMHFVPFPAPQDETRYAGATLDLARVQHGPGEAITASGIRGATRARLIARSDGPVYLISNASGARALRADNLADATVRSFETALSIAAAYVRHHWKGSPVAPVGVASYDQWTLSSAYDRYRPLYRVAIDDGAATEIYVSSTTGDVVLVTTGRARAWNYAGSILHWIYFTPLRSHPAVWSTVLWWLSLLALVAAVAGAVLGACRMKIDAGRMASPFRGWQAWHHWLGLVCMPFILTWMFSGWLLLDDGLLFSSGRPNAAETAALRGEVDWNTLSADETRRIPTAVSQVNWFAFNGRIYRHERENTGSQRLFASESENNVVAQGSDFLAAEEIDAAVGRLTARCEPAFRIPTVDDYAPDATRNGRVFRVVCGSNWFHIAATDGTLLEKLDPSRRRYRWLADGLHKLDFPGLNQRPTLRTLLIGFLCLCGLLFSSTAMAIAWRRILSCLPDGTRPYAR